MMKVNELKRSRILEIFIKPKKEGLKKKEMSEKEGYPPKRQHYHDTQGKCLKDDYVLTEGDDLELSLHLKGGCELGCGCCGDGCEICCVIL